jgi:DnaJ-class molecular chaperone
MQDYYQILGVSRSATQEEIRKAYKKLARENHPDVKPGDKQAADRFKQATEAYDVLGDPEKRKKYDQFGHAFRPGAAGSSPFGAGPVDLRDLFGSGFDLGDLLGGEFGSGFSGGRGARAAARGRDIRTSIVIPFDVAAQGGTHSLSLQRGGETVRLDVKIPAGIRSGSVVRLAGQGEEGTSGGETGDLLITVEVAPHPYFRREGDDVLIEVPITVTESALGARIDVPTLSEGLVTVTVPAGTSSAARLRLRGKGFVNSRTGHRGDQFVIVRIVVPRQLSPRAEELLRDFAAEAPLTPRDGLW